MTPRLILPFDRWPEIDRAAWTAAQSPGNVFIDGGGAAAWSTKNVKQIAKSYGRWLAYLAAAGMLDPTVAPDARASADALRGFVEALRRDHLSSETVFSTVRNLKDALRVMAPGAELGPLKRLVARLDRERTPSRDKARRIEDPVRLLQAGLDFIDDRTGSGHPRHNAHLRAGWARDGLIVALLACRPLRLANLTAIRLERHLTRRGAGWWLSFSAEETKERQPLDLPWPPILGQLLEKYLDEWRPVLLKADSDALWISNRGRPMTEQAVYYRVVFVTKTVLGRPVNPHLFRDSALTKAAEDSPEALALVSKMLGHRSLKTGEQHYNHARQVVAQARYHEALSRLLRDIEDPEGDAPAP